MKNYLCTDIAATLMFLAVVLVGGYFYLHEQVIEQDKQKESLQQEEKRVELKTEKKQTFEHLSKRTE